MLLGGLVLFFLVLRKGQFLGAGVLILAFQLLAARHFANSISQQVQTVLYAAAYTIALRAP